ncbi:MAG: hypothetical protein ABSA54_03780 [Terriglobales bacterium]
MIYKLVTYELVIYEGSTRDGWKTSTVLHRCDIVDEHDNWEAARVLHAKREAARMVVGATYKETCESRIEPTTSTQTRQ